MARAVDDLALVLPIIAGPDGEDPHVMPVPLRSAADVELAGLRVVVFTDNGLRTPTTETVETVLGASRVLESAGVQLREERPPAIDRLAGLYDPLVGADGHAWLRRLLAAAGTPGAGSYERWLPASTPLPGDELTALVEELDRIRATLHRWVQDVDLIVSPVMPQPAVRHGETDEPWFDDTYSEVHNLTGWPSGVVRAGTSPEGLPIGVQLVGGPWREDIVLAAARIIESELGGWQPPPR
jgi:amidase